MCVFMTTLIPIVFIKQIYHAIGMGDEMTNLAAQYVWIVGPSIGFYT